MTALSERPCLVRTVGTNYQSSSIETLSCLFGWFCLFVCCFVLFDCCCGGGGWGWGECVCACVRACVRAFLLTFIIKLLMTGLTKSAEMSIIKQHRSVMTFIISPMFRLSFGELVCRRLMTFLGSTMGTMLLLLLVRVSYCSHWTACFCRDAGGCLLSCCLTSTEARWPIRDGDRVGRGREWKARPRKPPEKDRRDRGPPPEQWKC